MTRGLIQYVMIAIVGLVLALTSVPAFSADVTGKTSTQTLPTQTNTQTAPLPSNTQTVPLPSNTREYQQMDKPPVKTLDIPDYDLAGKLKIERVRTGKRPDGTRFIAIDYRIALMNKGKERVTQSVSTKVRLINTTNQTVFKEYMGTWSGNIYAISNDYWRDGKNFEILFNTDRNGAPHTINDVKMIVDIDPDNVFGEAQRFRGNNRCIATW